ncbi:MAG: M23 family metallopeptidase, partial [Saprospiraceae bacterium]|nr:M23 family metallopeptidase [Saprospiraceae bacterium]
MRIYLTALALLLVIDLVSQEIPEIQPMGGGEYIGTKGPCLTDEERKQISAMLEKNVEQLIEEGLIGGNHNRSSVVVSFDWPLRKTEDLPYYSYYATNNFVDQNSTSALLDYNCGARTYNGHRGMDYDTWPFPWYIYENDFVEVIAAEGGTIIGKSDGNDDDHCSCSGSWNAVYIQHTDGSGAWYGHLKKNSLTSKGIGETVSKGEYLGVLASSGCSTQPHLHFEVYDALDNLVDPYQGPCNTLNSQSWWANQKPYREPTLNAIFTHDSTPIHGCPGVNENPRFSDVFYEGDPVYTALYFHDELLGDLTTLRIRRPNGSIWNSWTHTSNDTYTRSWWWWSWFFGVGEPSGTWTFEADYYGQTFTKEFEYIDRCPLGRVTFSNQSQIDSFPMKYPDCTDILGDVIIQESDLNNITNLDSLAQIRSVGGSLIIIDNTTLTSIAGIRGITQIEDDLTIQNSAMLSTCEVKSICDYLDQGGS